MLQEKEILFDEPDDISSNLKYAESLKSMPLKQSSKDDSHKISNKNPFSNEKSKKPSTSSFIINENEDLLLAKRLQEKEEVIKTKWICVKSN